MVGNTVFVVLLRLIAGTDSRKVGQQIAAWLIAALAKFAVLYLIVVKVVCGVMAPSLLAAGTLKEPMLKVLPATFSWPQLITALIGGGIALLWAIPGLTDVSLIVRTLLTAYLVIGALLEERKLTGVFGETYLAYRQRTPMLFPWRLRSRTKA